jgi:transcriptional regulator with XRE-family HTH domain
MEREPTGRQNGAAIRAMRRLSRRGAADFAAQVGLHHHQALRNIENNSRPASAATIRAIADLLGVPVAAIMRDGHGASEDEDRETAGAAA